MKYVAPTTAVDEPRVTSFLDALAATLTGRLDPSSRIAAHCTRVFDALNELNAQRRVGAVADHATLLPACAHIRDAVGKVAETAQQDLIDVARGLNDLTPMLRWMRRAGLRNVVPDFDDRHANGLVVGAGGLIESSEITIGATVMAPGTTYTDHSHPPEEVYLVLSSGEWRHGDTSWWQPGVGGFVHNEPGIVHAMRADTNPLFAVWLLRST